MTPTCGGRTAGSGLGGYYVANDWRSDRGTPNLVFYSDGRWGVSVVLEP